MSLKSLTYFAGLLAALAFPVSVLGQESCFRHSDPGYLKSCIAGAFKCKEQTWTSCYEDKAPEADKRLNEIYRQTLDVAPVGADISPRRDELISVQRSWLRWRDDHCRFEAASHSGRDGEATDFYFRACIVEQTLARTQYLLGYQNLLKDRQ